MKRQPWYSTVGRIVCYLLVMASYVLLLNSLAGCGVVTGFLEDIGIPVGSGTKAKAAEVDRAITGWAFSWVDWLIGAASSEAARATHRVAKKVRAKRKENREAKRRADAIIGAARNG